MRERLTNLEDKTGQRLATLTQQIEQIQQAIPNKTAFPLKLFLSGEVVTYRGILGTLSFSGVLVADLQASLLRFSRFLARWHHLYCLYTRVLETLPDGNYSAMSLCGNDGLANIGERRFGKQTVTLLFASAQAPS